MSVYIKLVVEALTDPKLLEAGPLGRDLYVRGLLYAKQQLTDGEIPLAALKIIGSGHRNPTATATQLCHVGLWKRTPNGFSVGEIWQKYQTTRAEVEQKRAAWREKKAKQRNASQKMSLGDTNGDIEACPKNVPPPEYRVQSTEYREEQIQPPNSTTAPPLVVAEPQPRKPKAPPVPRERNPMFDAVAEVTASDPKLRGSLIAKKALELDKAGYTPQDVLDFGVVYAAMHPIQSVCSLTQLTAHVGVVRSERGLAILRNGGVAPQRSGGGFRDAAPVREPELPVWGGDEA